MKLKYCKKCILPITKPDLEFDDIGVCQGCKAFENREIIATPTELVQYSFKANFTALMIKRGGHV